MINYELAKELKEAGLSQEGGEGMTYHMNIGGLPKEAIYHPSLEELIEACGEDFSVLQFTGEAWRATCGGHTDYGQTPTEAVARLWLALNKHA